MKGKYIQLAIGVVLTILFLFLAYRNIGHLDVGRIFHYPVHYLYVLLAIFTFAISQWFRALSWSRGMAPTIPIKRMFAAVCMGNCSNMLLPFRIGEVVRIMTISRVQKKDYAVAGVNLLIERLLDVAILILLAVSVAFFVPFESAVQEKLGYVRNLMLFGMVVGVMAVYMIMRYRKSAATAGNVPALLQKIFGLLDRLTILQSPLTLLRTLFYLVCSWGCVYLSTVFGLMSVGLFDSQSWVASLVVVVLTNLIMLVPSAPGGIGVFQYACTYALSLFHVYALQMAILSILLHLIQYAAILPLGVYYFIKGEFTLKSLFKGVLKGDARLS